MSNIQLKNGEKVKSVQNNTTLSDNSQLLVTSDQFIENNTTISGQNNVQVNQVNLNLGQINQSFQLSSQTQSPTPSLLSNSVSSSKPVSRSQSPNKKLLPEPVRSFSTPYQENNQNEKSSPDLLFQKSKRERRKSLADELILKEDFEDQGREQTQNNKQVQELNSVNSVLLKSPKTKTTSKMYTLTSVDACFYSTEAIKNKLNLEDDGRGLSKEDANRRIQMHGYNELGGVFYVWSYTSIPIVLYPNIPSLNHLKTNQFIRLRCLNTNFSWHHSDNELVRRKLLLKCIFRCFF